MHRDLFQGVTVDPKLSIGGKPVEGLPENQLPAGMAGAIVSGKGALLEFGFGENRSPARFVGTGVMNVGLDRTEATGVLVIDGITPGPVPVNCQFTVREGGVHLAAQALNPEPRDR
jgi:hypothetical protein